MKKSVATLSGAALALLLSAGQSMAGSVSLATYLATSKTTIYQNETLTLNAALHTRDNAQDCSTGFPPQQVVYKVAGGADLCREGFTREQIGPSLWEYRPEPCTVSGAGLPLGINTLVAEISSGYCTNVPGQTNNWVQVTVLAGNAPAAVPTTSEWTLWGLTGLLLIGGGVFASRRFRATAA